MKKLCLFIAVFILFVLSCDNLYNKVAEEKKDMQRLVFVNANGESVDLTKDPYGITEWSGFANTGLNLQTQQVPFHDGSVYLDGLLSERELSVTLAMNDNKDLEKRYQLRRELISILNPKLGEGTLIYTNDYISKQIKCVPQIPLFENHNSNDTGTPKANLAWTACNPYWEDVDETVEVIRDGMTFVVENEGDIETNVEISVQGDSQNFQIINQTTEKIIKVNNISSLNEAVINTNYGEKSAYNIKSEFFVTNGRNFNDIYGNDKLTIYVGEIIAVEDLYGRIEYINIEATIQSITFGNGVFVAVGESGKIFTSETAYNWEEQTSPVSSKLSKIAYGNGKFVAVGVSGVIITSVDGINWNQETSPTSKDLVNVIYGGGVWVINAYNFLASSSDISNWNVVYDTNISRYSNCAIYVEGYFVLGAVGTSGVATPWVSSDGASWRTLTITGIDETDYDCWNVAYNGSVLIISDSTGSPIFVATVDLSSGGIAKRSTSLAYASPIKYISEQKIFKASSKQKTSLVYSADGMNWNTLKRFFSASAMTFGNGKFVAMNNNSIGISTDGEDFVKIGVPNFSPNYGYFNNNEYIFVGLNGVVSMSNDGTNWTRGQTQIQDVLNGVVSGYLDNELRCFIVGDLGVYLRYNSETYWQQVMNVTYVKSIAYGNNIFIAVGRNGVIIRKRPQTFILDDWEYLFFQNVDWRGVAFGAGVFVIVGDNGKICVTDGKGSGNEAQGKIISTVTTENITKIIYAKNIFVICTENGNFFKSYNGYDWIFVNSAIPINAFAFGNEDIIGAGYRGLTKYLAVEKENIISNVTTESDMGLYLKKGKNDLKIVYDGNQLLSTITYRQKYIGV